MDKYRDRTFLCLLDDKYLRIVKSCICGTAIEIKGAIRKLIHSSKKNGQKIFWSVL